MSGKCSTWCTWVDWAWYRWKGAWNLDFAGPCEPALVQHRRDAIVRWTEKDEKAGLRLLGLDRWSDQTANAK